MNVFRDFIYPLLGLVLIVTGTAMIYRPAAGVLVAGLYFLFLSIVTPKTK